MTYDKNAMPRAEAANKWCPFARVMGFDEEGAGNRGPGQDQIPTEARCIGDQCMIWQWATSPEEGLGYCGLARGAAR
jgi:hypothetical protein